MALCGHRERWPGAWVCIEDGFERESGAIRASTRHVYRLGNVFPSIAGANLPAARKGEKVRPRDSVPLWAR